MGYWTRFKERSPEDGPLRPPTQPMALLAVCCHSSQSAPVTSPIAFLSRHGLMTDMAALVQSSISSGLFTVMVAALWGVFPHCDPRKFERLKVSAVPRFLGDPFRAVLVFLLA